MRSHNLRPIAAITVTALLAAAGCSSTAPAGGQRVVAGPGRITVPSKVSRADWPTFDRTSGRDGVSVSSPPMGKIRKSWTAKVDGAAYAQPLIVGTAVIVGTENDTVYALSASTGKVRWSHHLASPVTHGLPCGNVLPSGITGTPVADLAHGRLWVVTYTSQPKFQHTLWALDLRTGHTITHRAIDAPGSDPKAEQERGALTLLGSRVYVPFGGLFGDCSDYKGRVVGAPISGTGKLVAFATASNRAGIWAPAGESVRDGALYVSTGNGLPANEIGNSDSVLRLGQGLSVLSRFTPSNFKSLSDNDQDLSSTAPALLPGGLVFQVGKEGAGYVLHDHNLGGTGGQVASATVCEGGFGGDAVDGSTVVFSCFGSLRAIRVGPSKKGGRPGIGMLWSVKGNPGPPIIAGGVVWVMNRNGSLRGYRLGSGKPVFSASLGQAITDFPTLAASGRRLVVTGSTKVVSFLGA
ncbi:MAG TPA: PQQ-binding-like beta-propeller repeat protein [Streptosporangiaceae bacterium]|nr:PQQ-binding-like beta-propeller repeat protein [Streptosporangiaceae bacterium]